MFDTREKSRDEVKECVISKFHLTCRRITMYRGIQYLQADPRQEHQIITVPTYTQKYQSLSRISTLVLIYERSNPSRFALVKLL